MGIACPQIVYPYLRGNVADIVTRAGFPPVHLAEINFQAMYEQQQAAAAAGSRAFAHHHHGLSGRGAGAAMKILVLGAGAWGTALAVSAGGAPRGHAVGARRRAGRAPCAAARENARYLPGIALPAVAAVVRGRRCAAALARRHDLVIVATPMAGLREHARAPCAAARAPVAWLCKGFEAPAPTARRPARPRGPGRRSRPASRPAC